MCVIDILNDSCSIRLFNCNRAPSTNRSVDTINYIDDTCNCIIELIPANNTVLIVGDFNLSTIDWSTDNCLKCSEISCTGVFSNLFYSLGLSQFVTESTHNNNALELVFSNDYNCISDLHFCNPFNTTDHRAIKFDILFNPLSANNRPTDFNYYDFNRAGWDSIISHLGNADFNCLFTSDQPVEFIFEKSYSILYECISLHVPLRVIRKKTNGFKYRS